MSGGRESSIIQKQGESCYNHHGCNCHDPYVFRRKQMELLFQDYSINIRRTTVSCLLGVYILATAVLAILHFIYQKAPTERNLYHTCLCVVGICLYIFINTKFLRTSRQLHILSYILWVLLLLFAFISLPLGVWTSGSLTSEVRATDGLWQFLFIIYCMYLLLHINFFVILTFGIALGLVHMAVVLVRLQHENTLDEFWSQVSAKCIPSLTVSLWIKLISSFIMNCCQLWLWETPGHAGIGTKV